MPESITHSFMNYAYVSPSGYMQFNSVRRYLQPLQYDLTTRFKNTGKYAIVVESHQCYPTAFNVECWDYGIFPHWKPGFMPTKYDLVEITQYNSRQHSYCVLANDSHGNTLDCVIGVLGLKILGGE